LLTVLNSKASQHSSQQSQIEKSVTHLLIATKQLLETLTEWSRHTATEGEVSDVYVRLGYEFNIACRAFTSIGVDTSDLGPVPELLREILEETLSQEASSASLDKFLPRIRDIIISLLHGLKRKQQKLRSRQSKESSTSNHTLSSSGSAGSLGSLNTGLAQMLENATSRPTGPKGSERRTGSGSGIIAGDDLNEDIVTVDEPGLPPRFSSMAPARQNSGAGANDINDRSLPRERQKSLPMQGNGGNPSASPPQYREGVPGRYQAGKIAEQPSSSHEYNATIATPPPPPPPPKQQDALAALQRGGELERRASRRYSAYQISKHLGASPNGVPMLPPSQHSPIPNRGKDVRESMNAVRIRGAGVHSRPKSSNRFGDDSPIRNATFAQRISEESNRSYENFKSPAELPTEESPTVNAKEDRRRTVETRLDSPPLKYPTSPLPNNVKDITAEDADHALGGETTRQSDGMSSDQPENSGYPHETRQSSSTDPSQFSFLGEQARQSDKEITLFLQYKSKIKKFVLTDGLKDLSIARLQLAFIEKFAWSTQNNGNDLPEIYIQDPVSGVRHELEDLSDVKDRSVLVLNVEVLDEVKRHIDEGLGGLRRMVEGLRNVVDGQQNMMQRVSSYQQDTAKNIARLAATPRPVASGVRSVDDIKASTLHSSTPSKDLPIQLSGVQALRHDLAMIRQTFSSLVSDVNTSITTLNRKASSLKTVIHHGSDSISDSSSGRAYVNAGKKLLGEESEKIVNRVDDLQDVVEDLRKDVVTRGVRPLPRQLETVSKSISSATAELKKMQEYLKREKPVWTKIWEKELELVCTDRDLLTMQEELAADLEDDLEKATQTFALVEQATKQQNIQSGAGGSMIVRNTSRGMTGIATDQGVDPVKAKDGVLGEVRALRPNHETRLEAIERAEKARQRELESRKEGEFSKELGTFVEEGRLKKSGGVEEAERLRKAKDERNRREAWEKQQASASSKGKEIESAPTGEKSDFPSGDEVVMSQEPGAVNASEQPMNEEADEVQEGERREELNGTFNLIGNADTRKSTSSWLPGLPAIFTG
jgi:hypothetical protein